MSQQKINYIVMAGLCMLALILGYFGISLPVTPEIPAPLPTPTPVDLSGYVAHEELALLQRQIETLSVTGGNEPTSFGAYQTNCWMEAGGNQWTAGDGCVWEVQSGATLDVQAGATVTLTSAAVTTQTVSSLTVSGVLDAQGTIINSGGTLTVNDHLDVANTLNYGSSDLYPVGSEDSNFQFSWGSQTITGTAALTTQKVGSPTAAWCSISAATFTATHCSTLIVGTTVTASVWISDGTAAPVGVDVDWLVIGIP
jgi:hypothetical protein